MANLAEVAEINPRLDRSLIGDLSESVSFVPMANVSELLGAITSEEDRKISDVIKGFTTFQDRDVLVAKITPCFENGKIVHARIGRRLGFGSTEFHVVRPKASRLDDRYLYHFLRQPVVREAGERRMTGSAGQKRVPKAFLEALEIPLPPLPEQRRIAAILDKADALRAKRREAIAKLDQLLQSVFLDMFGDISADGHGWPEVEFNDLVESTRLGLVRGASGFGDESRFNIPYIRMDAIGRRGEFLQNKVKKTTATAKELVESSVRYGDFLFNTRNSKELVGKSAVIDFNLPSWTFNNNVMRIRFNHRANPFYMLRYLLSRRGQMELDRRKSGTTNVFAVYYKDLKTLPVVLPPKTLQDKFQRMVEEQRKVRNRAVEQETKAQALMQTLQQAAFSGQL